MSLDKPHSNSLASNESATKFLSNKLRVSQHVLHNVPMRVKGQGQKQHSTKRPFFLKRLKFPEATKINALHETPPKKQTMRM